MTASATSASAAHCLADEGHRVLACDDALLELLGRERREVIGKHPLDFTHPLDCRLNQSLLHKLSDDGAAFSITKRYVRPDGGLLWVTNAVAPVRDGMGPLRVSATSVQVETPRRSSALARNAAAARQMCATFVAGKELFGADLLSAPAAEILLQLYIAEIEGVSLTGDDLARILRIALTSSLRWLQLLTERELIEVEREEPVSGATSYRIARRCEIALDALIVRTDL